MQSAFTFAAEDIAFIRAVLVHYFGPLPNYPSLDPIWRLVRSLIGARTYDADADAAFERLRARCPEPTALAAAAPGTVAQLLGPDVSYAADKAAHLTAALRQIATERGDHDLGFLRGWPVRDALVWLERLPGVGPKVAAATLNASSLAMPAFIVDGHVHRVLLRFGFISPQASERDGRDSVTEAGLAADALLDLFRRLKRLGQTLCRPYQAECGRCPLAARCRKLTHLGVPRSPARAKIKSLPVPATEEEIIAAFQSPAIAVKAGSSPGDRA